MNQSSIPQWGKAALKLLGVNAFASPADEIAGDLPVDLRPQILSTPHGKLFRALSEATADEASVLAKARLVDFLQLTDRRAMETAVSLDRAHVDFLIIDSPSMQPLAVVQLIRKTQSLEIALQGRKAFIANALKSSGITVLGIRERDEYPIGALRRKLLPRLYHAAIDVRTNDDPAISSA